MSLTVALLKRLGVPEEHARGLREDFVPALKATCRHPLKALRVVLHEALKEDENVLSNSTERDTKGQGK